MKIADKVNWEEKRLSELGYCIPGLRGQLSVSIFWGCYGKETINAKLIQED